MLKTVLRDAHKWLNRSEMGFILIWKRRLYSKYWNNLINISENKYTDFEFVFVTIPRTSEVTTAPHSIWQIVCHFIVLVIEQTIKRNFSTLSASWGFRIAFKILESLLHQLISVLSYSQASSKYFQNYSTTLRSI